MDVGGIFMEIYINDHFIQIEVIRKNNKNLYMRFRDAQTLTVTCNRFVSEKEILKIIEKNKDTLETMYLKKLKETENDYFFQYLGKKYTRVFDGESKDVYFLEDNVIAKDEKTLESFYKKECLRVFTNEVERITPYFKGIPNFSLKIRLMKSRWGVNNRGNNTITLNSELLKKDLDLLDYVIIHELCHFYEANHSSRFWDHVARYYPKYKEARRRLRS